MSQNSTPSQPLSDSDLGQASGGMLQFDDGGPVHECPAATAPRS